MKKLTKVRLINWHFFANETLNIKNNTLITGQNATGKSTIIDAIAFVITAGDQIFNLAANEKSKRDLRGYVKCKLGIDNQEYLRVGDITGHVALEFFDETLKKYFVVGAVIDVFGEVMAPKVLFWEYEGAMEEKLFVDNENRIYSTLTFKKAKLADKVHPTRREAKLSFRSRFGSINETYFSLIPKALAFKPIADVKDFIYHYLLEEKTLDVESIKESIHAYRDLEATLKIIKLKVSDLQDMKANYDEILKNQDQKKLLEFLLKIIDLENVKAQIQAKIRQVDKNDSLLQKYAKTITDLDHQIDAFDQQSKDLYAQLQSDETFQTGEMYDKEIARLMQAIDEQKEIERYFVTRVEKIRPMIQELKTDYPCKAYDDLAKIDLLNIRPDALDKARFALIEIEKTMRETIDANMLETGRIDNDRKALIVVINDIYQTLKELENHQMRYNPMVKELQVRIKEGVKTRYGVDISVHVLAELIEVTDPKWHNTIEDYLGPQRFNLIVEPRYFDEALQVYNKIKDQFNIYGIGLVNTKKIVGFINHQPKSLASIIASDNVDAMHYINMTCGSLIMVTDVTELEQYPQAITVTGMVYRSYTVRSLNRNTEKPFIGKQAQQEQLEQWKFKAKEAKEQYQKFTDKLAALSDESDLIKQINIKQIVDSLGTKHALSQLGDQLKNAKLKKQNLPQASIEEMRIEYESIRVEIRNMNNNKRHIYEETGKVKASSIQLQEELVRLEEQVRATELSLQTAPESEIALIQDAIHVFNIEIKDAPDRQKIEIDTKRRIDVELSNLKNLEDSLRTKQFRYVNAYNLSYPLGIENMYYFLDELNKLVKSELVKYESKVREAREAAEKLFKEDFIAKLRNYIITAQDEIAKINDTLKTIHFGDDTYEFIFPKSKEYADYYDMVLSDESMKTGVEIFNYDFEMKYQRQLEELFINLASEDLNNNGSINKFTDYRTYMDYDIKIINSQGDIILYSKVFKEKSGGETQVPFYVATIASFVRVFQQARRGGVSDAIGLILFDEVFDKMDTTRIKAMMDFINRLPVQILLATPPQKMEVLAKYTDTTVVTLREGKAARAYEVVQKY
ncbi:MAG: hypothetical protein MZU97_26020 [Bacillus subtilis]|nr:hypothetical protein [Bacillus subtilis]